ncbi:MAG: porin [Methylophilaceae bacterium]|nr:porin [Methylophilaceae bacterium]
MNLKCKKKLLLAAVLAASGAVGNAHAGATITFGEDKSVSVGFGIRSSFSSVERGATDGSSWSSDFNINNARIFLGGSLNKYIKGMFTTDISNGNMVVIDAIGRFEFMPEFNIWAGRMLSPSDRANLAGPFYSLGGGYGGTTVSVYGADGGKAAGRDDGVTVWGNLFNSKLGYSFGVFEGYTLGIGSQTPSAAGAKTSDNLMYAGRLQYDFWDAEPGYYGTGNYLGAKDILAIGFAGRYQEKGVITGPTAIGDYAAYNVDFLLEKRNIGPGAISVEAAYYDYDTDGVVPGKSGNAYLVGGGYIFNQKIGWGQFQPYARYQKFNAENHIGTGTYDIGLNYIIDGYNAQVTGKYTNTKVSNQPETSAFSVALQLQF